MCEEKVDKENVLLGGTGGQWPPFYRHPTLTFSLFTLPTALPLLSSKFTSLPHFLSLFTLAVIKFAHCTFNRSSLCRLYVSRTTILLASRLCR